MTSFNIIHLRKSHKMKTIQRIQEKKKMLFVSIKIWNKIYKDE